MPHDTRPAELREPILAGPFFSGHAARARHALTDQAVEGGRSRGRNATTSNRRPASNGSVARRRDGGRCGVGGGRYLEQRLRAAAAHRSPHRSRKPAGSSSRAVAAASRDSRADRAAEVEDPSADGQSGSALASARGARGVASGEIGVRSAVPRAPASLPGRPAQGHSKSNGQAFALQAPLQPVAPANRRHHARSRRCPSMAHTPAASKASAVAFGTAMST